MASDRKEYFKAYRLRNRDKNLAYQRLWRQKNPDKIREYEHRNYNNHAEQRRDKTRKYYAKHPEKAKAASAKWRLRNLDRINKTHANWKAKNREQFLARKRRGHLAVYGLTEETFNEMLSSQGGVCAICHNAPSSKRRLHIDHDHNSGRVRALLCTRCNCAIGLAKENPETLRSLAGYLELHCDSSLRSVCS